MKISSDDLAKIHDLSKYYYREGTNANVKSDYHVALAWVQAVMGVLQPDVKLEFPQRNSTDSIFDE